MFKRIVLSVALALVSITMQACSSDPSSGGGAGGSQTGDTVSGSGGSAVGSGGSIGSGGSPSTGGAVLTGGLVASGGSTTASGGATTATGGKTTANGGATTASGGATSASGGTTTASGGATTAAGGSTSASGGATTAAGGARTGGTTGSGGSTTASGGATGATGGATGKGGSTGTGGTTTATGGTSAAGGRTGAGGTTGSGGCDVWVATDGDDTNSGTASAPLKTLAKGYDLLCPPVQNASNGDPCSGALTTMCIKSGTYAMSTKFELKKTRMGTASRIITIQADPAATKRPILDFSSQPRLQCGKDASDKNQRGIDLGADYFHIKGLEVMGSNDNGIMVQGAHNTIENCVVHDCADFGIAIGSGSGYTGSGTYNTILNCDSYHNFDSQCSGENADGFGAKKGSGEGNVFRGCRAWSDSDDGWDFYGWTSSITVENCWAFNMATEAAYSGSNSDGNGFKLGSDSSDGGHKLANCISFGNKAAGFTNNGGKSSSCTSCKSCSNGKSDTGVSGVTSGGCPSASAAQAPRSADGSLPAI